MDADPQCNMTEMLLCDVIEQLDEEAERTGVVAELPGTSLLQVLEPRFNGDESFVNIDRIESVQIDTNLWLLRGDVSLNRLEDYIAEAHTQRFYSELCKFVTLKLAKLHKHWIFYDLLVEPRLH